MLNHNQRRSLSATARTLERHIFEIEMLCRADDYQGGALTIHNDLPPHARHEIALTLSSLRGRLALLAEDFSLDTQTDTVSRMTVGKLNACWEMLEESRARRLSGYGALDQAEAGTLDSHINTLIALCAELERVFRDSVNTMHHEDNPESLGENPLRPSRGDT